MALTQTPAPEIGQPMPVFDLAAVDGKRYSGSELAKSKKALLVMFICNHCPYVKAVEDRLINLARRWESKGVGFVAICSNDSEGYPEDSFGELKKRWELKSYGFPYLHDETQAVAKKFGAVCTPDFFLYDQNQKLVYRGRLDDSWKDSSKVTQEELSQAIQAALNSEPPLPQQKPSMGCSIKWRG